MPQSGIGLGEVKMRIRISQRWRVLLAGLSAGLIGVLVTLTPLGSGLEEQVGLSGMFLLRGSIAAPENTLIVSIDRQATDALGLPLHPAAWSRQVHADLVRRLSDAGARVVVYDLFFGQPRDEGGDTAFAESIREAGNVVLLQRLEATNVAIDGPQGERQGDLIFEELRSPLQQLAEPALALAPNILPKVPRQLSQFWTFKPDAADAPTLPVVALQAARLDLYEELHRSLAGVAPDIELPSPEDLPSTGRLHEAIAQIRTTMRIRPAVATKLLAEANPELRRLLDIYTGDGTALLNLYGPPRTLNTVSLDRVLAGELPDLRGQTVFVGVSDFTPNDQRDAFPTTFSLPDGTDTSGVELSATAYANLADGRLLSVPDATIHLALLIGWGLLMAIAWSLPWQAVQIALTLSMPLGLLAVSMILFAGYDLWLPLIVPILVQFPLFIVFLLGLRILHQREERALVGQAFGDYRPLHDLARSARGDDRQTETREVHGICLFSDAGQFTTLSERLDSSALSKLMNGYFEAIFEPIGRGHGTVSNQFGDSMHAYWECDPDAEQPRIDSCRAALAVLDAAARYARQVGYSLPTRIGLNAGHFTLGPVGGHGHFEYRAFGDTVNTASRIEGMCKQLGVNLLASAEVADGLAGMRVRNLGRFILVGKRQVCELLEVRGIGPAEDPGEMHFLQDFGAALKAFQERRWFDAIASFEQCLNEHGEDRASRFYLERAQLFSREPPSGDWSGEVRMTSK
jgi:adenylate cyclase